jgi:hypothetical protein
MRRQHPRRRDSAYPRDFSSLISVQAAPDSPRLPRLQRELETLDPHRTPTTDRATLAGIEW